MCGNCIPVCSSKARATHAAATARLQLLPCVDHCTMLVGGGVYNDYPVGVRYDEDRERWAVYNQDFAPIKAGAAFNVSVPETNAGS